MIVADTAAVTRSADAEKKFGKEFSSTKLNLPDKPSSLPFPKAKYMLFTNE